MKLLEIANLFSVEFNIKFIICKYQLIYYNNDKNCTESDINVAFNDSIIHNDMHARHLGNIIGIKSTDAHIDECTKTSIKSQYTNCNVFKI